MKYEILIKDALLIDPWNQTMEQKDLAIKDSHIAKISNNISHSDAHHTIQAKGLYLTPGLIDAHTHCFYNNGVPAAWAGDYGINPDCFSFKSGVTTMIDTGSTGHYNFSQFYATVIERVQTRVLALLNISDWGMNTLLTEQFPDLFDIDKCIKCIKKYNDIIIGVKVAHYWYEGWDHVNLGLKVSKETNVPLMVDFGRFKKERPTDQLLNKLQKGDILTHCYRAPVPVIDSNGKVFDYLRKAREKGILFDLGHGQGSFLFRNALPAIQQDFKPDFVSTDIHALSMNDACQDMVTVMSKCLAMGMSFEEIITASTVNPAKAFKQKQLCRIEEGSNAELALFSINQGSFAYKDICGGILPSDKRISCELTIKDGKVVWDYNARYGIPYQELPELCGIDPVFESYTPPKE